MVRRRNIAPVRHGGCNSIRLEFGLPVPHAHRMAPTFSAGLRTRRLVAPLMVDGAFNGELFGGYVELQLAPSLVPGAVFVPDDLNSHEVAGVWSAIEQVFAKFNWLIRRAAPPPGSSARRRKTVRQPPSAVDTPARPSQLHRSTPRRSAAIPAAFPPAVASADGSRRSRVRRGRPAVGCPVRERPRSSGTGHC